MRGGEQTGGGQLWEQQGLFPVELLSLSIGSSHCHEPGRWPI